MRALIIDRIDAMDGAVHANRWLSQEALTEARVALGSCNRVTDTIAIAILPTDYKLMPRLSPIGLALLGINQFASLVQRQVLAILQLDNKCIL